LKKKIVAKKKSGKKVSVVKSLPVKKTAVPVAAAKPGIAANTIKPAAPAPVQAKPAQPAVPVKKHVLYVEVTPDKYFVLCDGRKVKSCKELADILQSINDDMFKYHVTDTKNDFSNWINDVFGEQDLAKKIKTIRSRLDTSIELYRAMFDRLDKFSKR
jgi:hypothetical protein